MLTHPKVSILAAASLMVAFLVCCSVARGQEPILSREKACHFYGQASQGASAWNKDDSCSIPRLEFLDTGFRQTDFNCCGGGATSPTTNADIPPGLEVVVTGGHYWSVSGPRLVGGQFFLHTYCGPEPPPGPGCNVDVEVWAHYRVVPPPANPTGASSGSGGGGSKESPPDSRKAEDPGRNPILNAGNLDKILAFAFGCFFAIVLLLIAIFDRNPTQLAIFIYRVVLALVAAGIGAVIPGMIDVNVQPVIRAGGAIALFVIVFWFNPPNLVTGGPKEPKQT